MSKDNIVVREIMPNDNAQIEAVIKACFPEFGIPLIGSAYEDSEIPKMYESYQSDKAVYFVIADADEVFGGGGIKQLKDSDGTICELQKMYFSPKIRGKGLGKLLITKSLESAKKFGYKACYLESTPQLKAAIHIYKKNGFKHLEKPLGNSGHYACGVWMLKDL